MTHAFYALYAHPQLGDLQLYFVDGVLQQLTLPRQFTLQDAYAPLPQEWQHKLDAYFSGELTDFQTAISPNGTSHDAKVWQAMCGIPYGQTRTYGDIAKSLGSAAQAVGNACARNPLPIIVPCHRIVGKNGLGGFNGSTGDDTVSIKHWLLEHERAHTR